MCCCSSSGPGQCAHAPSSRAAQSPVSCVGCGERERGPGPGGQLSSDTERVHTSRHQARGLQPLSSDTRHEGQSREGPESRVQPSTPACHVPRVDDNSEAGAGQTECSACSDMVRLETGGGLWSGVSGVPGLGVSIPRSLSSGRPVSSLSEWDSHENRERRSNSDNRRASVHGIKGLRDPGSASCQAGSKVSPLSLVSGVKVDIPRVLSPRSSECRSSGRSTGSRGSSAISQNLSHGSSSSSSKYSNRLVATALSVIFCTKLQCLNITPWHSSLRHSRGLASLVSDTEHRSRQTSLMSLITGVTACLAGVSLVTVDTSSPDSSPPSDPVNTRHERF